MQKAPAQSVAHQPQAQTTRAPVSMLESIAEETHARYGAELFAPRSRDELRADADTMYRAGLLKKYLPREADSWNKEARYAYATNRALIAFLAGAELGLLPMQAVRGIYFVEDQPYPAAKTLVGIIKKRIDICEYWMVEESTDIACTIVTKRRGAPKEERLRVTIEQFAKLRDEKNYKGDPKRPPWTLYPSRQLHARCSSWLGQQTYQDLTLGFYAAEEMSSAVWERKYSDLGRSLAQVPAGVGEDIPDDLLPDQSPVEAPPPPAREEQPEHTVGADPLADAARFAEHLKALMARIETMPQGQPDEAVREAIRVLPDSAERRGLIRAFKAKEAAPATESAQGGDGGVP